MGTLEKIKLNYQAAKDSTINAVKQAGENFSAPTPYWAKIVQISGLVLLSAGASLATGGAALPAVLVSAAPYLTITGTFLTTFFQFFKKTQ